MNPERRPIGIIGGMGPEATILLMQRIVAAVDAGDDSDHIPLVVDQNTQIPSRIAHLIEGEGIDPGPVLADMAKRLGASGVTALAMPCNTAHHYAPAIRGATDLPFLDMVAAACDAALAAVGPDGKIGILGSPALQLAGVYDAALSARGLTAVYPKDPDALLAAIRAIKAKGPSDAERQMLISASQDLKERGASVQLVACTEFSMIADAVADNVHAIDTLDCLITEILSAATGAEP